MPLMPQTGSLLAAMLSRAVDLIENRSRQVRPFKVVKVRRRYDEDADEARDRHYAAHPEDRGANIVIFEFYEGAGRADDS